MHPKEQILARGVVALVDSKPDTSPHDRRTAPTTENPLTTTHAPWQTLVHTHVCAHKHNK